MPTTTTDPTTTDSNPKATTSEEQLVRRLHSRLPSSEMTEDGLMRRMPRVAGIYEGDHALAEGLISTLVAACALTVRVDAKTGARYYKRAPKLPEYEDVSPGSEAFNRELKRQHEAEDARYKADLEASRQRNDTLHKHERAQFDGEVLRAVRPLIERVERLEALLGQHAYSSGDSHAVAATAATNDTVAH